jgi:hypothetical protein
MYEVEPALEGALIAILLRVVFRFDASLWIACATGVGSRIATAYFGPAFVPPDWWLAELFVASATTLALLGVMQTARASW